MNVCAAALLTLAIATDSGSTGARAEPEEAEASEPEQPEPGEPSAEELDEQARAAYKERDYGRAAELFERAYDTSGDPNYLFNIGRVHEEAGQLEQAVTYYQRFLDQPEVELSAREDALGRLRVLTGVLEARERKEAGDASQGTGPDPTLDDRRGLDPIDPAVEKRRRKLLIAGGSLAGIGAAAIVTGAILGGLAQRQDRLLEDEEIALEDRRRRISAANTYAITADGLFIAGGVVAATGLGLVIASVAGRGRARAGSSATLRWAPSVTRHQLALGLSGRF